MQLQGIEPTPSPNTMKLTVDTRLPAGRRFTYTPGDADAAPEPLRRLLAIEGVRSLFHTADFIALDRKPNADWPPILEAARAILLPQIAVSASGSSDAAVAKVTPGKGSQHQTEAEDNRAGASRNARDASDHASFGEVHVLVQMYRGIPMQLRVQTSEREVRIALPEVFIKAVQAAAGSGLIRERKLEELGVRYGEPEEVAEQVSAELAAAYPAERLEALVAAAKAQGKEAQAAARAGGGILADNVTNGAGDVKATSPPRPTPLAPHELAPLLEAPNWETRYAALARAELDPQHLPELLPLLERALNDDNTSIRRLAVVLLGDIRQPAAVQLLINGLQDRSAAVRRTAGDTLSDVADPAAIRPMCAALQDRSKLVRWRAARFLYELGDETALEALRIAAQDDEFEVRLQAQMALERIARGEEAAGTVWQQMTTSRKGN